MRRFVLPIAGVLAAGLATVAVAAPAQAKAAGAGGAYVAVKQTRLVSGTVVHAGKTLTVTVGGRAGVPTSGAAAVVGTISVTTATASGGITAWGPGSAPGTTNLQFTSGKNTADTAVVALSGGKIKLKDTQSKGTVHVYFDVSGYYAGGASKTNPGSFNLTTPTRVVDTRSGRNTQHAALHGGRALVGSLGGHGGIPASGVGTVAVTITATSPTAAGSLTAYAGGTSRPAEQTLFFAKGRGVSVFALVPVSVYSRFDVYAGGSGSTQVVVDTVGWFPPGAAVDKGAYTATPPSRQHHASLGAHKTVAVRMTGRGGVPLTPGTTVFLTVIASGSGSGRLTAWASGASRPGTAALQWQPGLSATNQVPVLVGSNGYVDVYNASSKAATVTVDVHGYAAPNTITPPTLSVGRYLNDLQNVTDSPSRTADTNLMQSHGCIDATKNTNFVLLDVGTQSITPDQTAREGELSRQNPGVTIALTGTGQNEEPVRIDYPELLSLLKVYVDAFANCGGGTGTTIAVGTNNDGVADYHDVNYYWFTGRGRDWANKLVDPLATYASDNHGIAVAGADDIESAFSSTLTQAQQWEAAYLAATGNDLIYNGDANSCPTSFNTTAAKCAYGWTEGQYYSLAHNGSRIKVLPQIFFPAEAVKWANINATGDSRGNGKLIFIGALTEHPRDTTTLTGDQGWAALQRSQSTVTASPSIPQSVVLQAG